MIIRTVTQPTALLLAIPDMKRHLGVSDDDHDLDIESLMIAAEQWIRARTKRSFLPATLRLVIDSDDVRPDAVYHLAYPPVSGLASVAYTDINGATQTANVADYAVVGNEFQAATYPLPSKYWPTVAANCPDALRIDFNIGPATPPEMARQACRLLVRSWYDNPSMVITGTVSKEIESGVNSLCRAMGMAFYAGCSFDETY